MSDQLNISFNNTAYPTNVTSVLGPAGHIALNVVLILVFIVPAIVFNILLIAAIILDKSNLAATRIALVNSIVGSTVTILTTFFYDFPLIARIAGTLDRGTDDSLGRFCYYLLLCSGLLRSVAVAIYSVVVFLIIKKGSKKVKAWPVAVATVAVWIIIIIIAIPVVLKLAHVKPVFADGYILRTGLTSIGFILVISLIFLVEIPAKIVSITLLVAILVYVKKNTITDGVQIKRSMIKFLVWFSIVNFLTTLLNIVVAAIGANDDSGDIPLGQVLVNYFSTHSIIMVSSGCLPLILLCQFSSIRSSFKKMICSCFILRLIASPGTSGATNLTISSRSST